MANTHTGRHDLHVIEALGAPFEKGKALRIALGFDTCIFEGGTGARNDIGGYGVINYERAGNLRVDAVGIPAFI